MGTTINKLSDVEYELEIETSAADLESDIAAALRKQRSQATLKGFRQGKVPASLVKKMYGKAIAWGVAEDHVQKVYRSTILDDEAYDVLGQPTITELDYDYEGDLKAKVRFGTRPEFDVVSIEGAELSRLVHTVEASEVDEELERMREREAELTVVDGPADEQSFVLTDLQALDAESGTAIVGERREDVAFYLGSEELPAPTKKALMGCSVGDTLRLHLVSTDTEEEAPFEATIKEIKRRTLPDLDDAFASSISKGQIETLDALRTDLEQRMQRSVNRTSKELLEGALIREVLDRHTFDVPVSVADLYVEQQLKDLKAQAGDRLPADFDEEAWKKGAHGDAERQAKWMFIRDKAVSEEHLEVSEEDRERYFQETGEADGLQPELLKQYYRSMPRLMGQLDERLLTEKVIGHFAGQATIVEKDRATFQAEAQDHEHDHGHDHDHSHDHSHDHDHNH
jgi:trigger factor